MQCGWRTGAASPRSALQLALSSGTVLCSWAQLCLQHSGITVSSPVGFGWAEVPPVRAGAQAAPSPWLAPLLSFPFHSQCSEAHSFLFIVRTHTHTYIYLWQSFLDTLLLELLRAPLCCCNVLCLFVLNAALHIGRDISAFFFLFFPGGFVCVREGWGGHSSED